MNTLGQPNTGNVLRFPARSSRPRFLLHPNPPTHKPTVLLNFAAFKNRGTECRGSRVEGRIEN
jgi:hypothetical protein